MKNYKEEHIWDQSNDRWIFLEHQDGILVGLNYMQGDEYEDFKDAFSEFVKAAEAWWETKGL